MPLERNAVILFDDKPRVDPDGWTTRNKELFPCGCFRAEVWRSIDPPGTDTEMTASAEPWADDSRGEFTPIPGPTGQIIALQRTKPNGGIEGWYLQSSACDVHSGRASIISLALTERLAPEQMVKWGDGARRLYADKERVLARAAELDQELLALGVTVPSVDRQLAAAASAARVPLLAETRRAPRLK